MDKDFEKLIDKVMDENDEVYKTLAKMEQEEKVFMPYIYAANDAPKFTRATLDTSFKDLFEESDNAETVREFILASADEFGEHIDNLEELSDEAIFELADWYEYLWTK